MKPEECAMTPDDKTTLDVLAAAVSISEEAARAPKKPGYDAREDMLRFLSSQVACGKLAPVAYEDALTNNPRSRQLLQMTTDALAWGREHPLPTPARLDDAPPVTEGRFDGLELD